MLMPEDKRLDEIIRVKRVAGTFATMNKTFLEDERLSFKAKGILGYLLSKPDDWKVVVRDIVEHGKDGKSAVYAGLKELKTYGYYKKEPVRNEDGSRIVRWESTVYEVPRQLFDDEPPKPPKGPSKPEQEELPKEPKEEQEIEVKKSTKSFTQKTDFLVSKFSKQEKSFLENKECNKKDSTKNYTTRELSSLSQTGYQTGQEYMFRVLDFIKRKINYADFEVTHENDMPLVDEFVSVVLDTILSTSGTVRINGTEKPRELVKSQLMKLTYQEFEFVLERFKGLKQKIKKKHQYILSMLYNAKMELNTHYTNLVQAEWGY